MKSTMLFFIVILAGLLLTACGNKGALVLPNGAAPSVPQSEATASSNATTVTPAAPLRKE